MLPEYNKAEGLSDAISKKMKNLGEYQKKAEGGEVEEKEGEFSELELVFAELLHAVTERNVKLGAQVLKDFFMMVDAQPHEEGEHREGPGALLITGEI